MAYEASSVTLSKKLSNGNHSSFAGASVYDGVFASPPKKLGAAAANLSSRAEDYSEIFGGGSEASSIPFLDVPELSEQKVSVDVRSSKLDYSKIFGGGGDSSFAVRLEELSLEPNARKKSEKEWTRAERLSPSEASENSSVSDGNNVRSSEASHQAFSGVKKFNMSYNKINNGNANWASGTNGATHIAQLDAVRGYAHLIDEATTLRGTEGGKPVVSVNDGCRKSNTYQGVTESNYFERASEDVPLGETVKQTSGADVESQSSPNWFKSNSMGKPYEVGRGSPRSKAPSSSSMPRNFNFGYGDDRTDRNGGSTSSSPPYFEEEVDTNSVAATSAAALRKAIEEAQARIKVAKEIMERKKAGLKNGGKSFSDRRKPEERKDGNVAYGVSRSKKKETHELCEEVEIPLRASSGRRQHNTTGPSNVAANFEVREKVPSIGETPRKEISSQADHRCEEAEVPEVEQFYDVENTSENWSPTIEVDAPHVSAMTSKQNVTGSGQGPEDFEVLNFISGAEETARETLCHHVKSSQADHRQEKAELAEVAEQFYEFEEVTRVQPVDENVRKEKTKAEEVFEKPQQGWEGLKPSEKEDNPEEVEKIIKIRNGINGASHYSEDGEEPRLEVEVFDHEKNEQKQRFSLKHKESGKIVQPFNENDKCERSSIEFLEQLNDAKQLEIRGLDDTKHMKRELANLECVESERKGEEECKQEENEKEQIHAHGLEDDEKRFANKAIKGERIKERLNGFHLGKKIAKILSHDVEPEVIQKIHERDYASQKEENENRKEESGQWVDSGRTSTKSEPSEGDENEAKEAVEEPRNQGNNLGAADNDKSENQKLKMLADDDETSRVSEEVPSCKDSGSSIAELSKGLLEANDSVEEKYDVEKMDVLRKDGFQQGLELTKIMNPLEDKTSIFLDENDASDEGRIGMNFTRKPRDHVEELSPECENIEYIEKSDVAVNQEDGEDKIECFGEQGRFASGTTMKEAQLSDSSEGGGNVGLDEETESSTSKEIDHENCEEIPMSQNEEVNEKRQKKTLPLQSEDRNEDNDRPAVHVEESTTNESLEKEVELERKQQKRIDEAKERERERERDIEKGRIAVERAVREARERAFAEARERAAADKAGARQRVKAETRERVGKTSGELNAKSVADKAREAKLKTERAAVERATAEARERALEKAMSIKTASQARKQNSQQKGPSSTSTSRYPYSSSDSVSNSTERPDGVNGESVQRCKARSERHQRISERAERALAEKNRRDLLAQKEQIERNRLAETLDIEVKRWSSGKEGNLRALLSTLQYILGPDSSWKPIPLTDIITTAAVKKAYRKATLFVHPDKLQQRGANIQQKYTCEKVFDLLKEAWNKFNVEER